MQITPATVGLITENICNWSARIPSFFKIYDNKFINDWELYELKLVVTVQDI